MRSYRAVLLAAALWLPGLSSAECVRQSGAYEGFLIARVAVETPLRFPVRWIERSLLGPAIDSLDSVASALPVQQGKVFHFTDHVITMSAIRDRYAVMKPGERIRLVLVVPHFPACDMTAHTVEVVYRVYTTDAAYFASRVLNAAGVVPDRSISVGDASEKVGSILPVPFAGYDRSMQFFGGMRATWTGKGTLFNTSEMEAGGSSSSYRAAFSLGGARDPERGSFSHLEWKLGFLASQEPSGALTLTKTVATGQAFAATRAYGPLGIMFRFGSSVEIGKVKAETGAVEPPTLPQRVFKSFAGATWNYNRQLWNASYGFQLGKGTDQAAIDYTKHLIDVTHQVRFLPREHWPIQLDSHFNAGWIRGSPSAIPVVERFFGGSMPGDFLANPLWKFPSNPLLRSFPHNLLNTVGPGVPIGGTSFAAVNVTAAFPVWSYPAMPAVIRSAKPLADGIHLGMQAAQGASLEDFRARTKLFPAVLKRAEAVVPNLEKLRDRLLSLTNQASAKPLLAELNDLLVTYIRRALDDFAKAKQVPNNGFAWSVCRKWSKDDPDTYPLAHLSDDLTNVVAPFLDTADLADDATFLRAMAKTLDGDKRDIAALLAQIEPLAVLPQSAFSGFTSEVAKLSVVARSLNAAAKPFVATPVPVGSLAFDVTEWSTSLVDATAALADPGPDPDPFDTLYVLGRLSVGIGKLVPPQIESAALAADKLAEALRVDRPSESGQIGQLAKDLRASLATIRPQLDTISIPSGTRWARQQNQYFTRALDVAFREMNLGAVSPVVVFDAARIGPQPAGAPAMRYGIGPGVRFSIVSFQITLGYSVNPNPKGPEKRGAFFFSMEVIDLFR